MLYCVQIAGGVWFECHGGDDSNNKNSGSGDSEDDMLLSLNLTPIR
jgi:hypothetical protein